jgi:hypothetical protein
MSTATAIHPVSNDAAALIGMPYIVEVSVCGTAPYLFHRWSVEGVEEKAKAAKGSKAKKEDDLESYVYRCKDGNLGVPGEQFRMSVVNAAKYKQDPRSPRKSAMDLFKAGIVSLEDVCSIGKQDWDYIDKRRVMIQRNGITRCRPALLEGWRCAVTFQCLLPEYVQPSMLNEVIQSAGKLCGVGDFRPTFGRFQVVKYEVMTP